MGGVIRTPKPISNSLSDEVEITPAAVAVETKILSFSGGQRKELAGTKKRYRQLIT